MARIRITVKPRSHASALCSLDETGLLTVSVTAAPADGQANRAVTQTLAKALGVPKSSVTVVRGMTARVKTVEGATLAEDELEERLKQYFSEREK